MDEPAKPAAKPGVGVEVGPETGCQVDLLGDLDQPAAQQGNANMLDL